MQEILEVAIPAVVLIPIIIIGVAVWIGLNYNAKSSVVRRAEFLRLQRLAVEEHERAEREYEREYSQQRQGDYRRREFGENDYRKPAQPQPQQEGWRQSPEAEIRRRKQLEEEEYHKRQAEADFHHRRMQAEADERRRREAAEDEIFKKRKAEERERERKIAELEAHLRREAEEERRRKLAEDEANRKRQQDEEARKRHEVGNKDVHPASNLHCLVCKNPTKRRCSRCKTVFYCSQACQLRHWKDGHKNECRPPDVSSPRGSEGTLDQQEPNSCRWSSSLWSSLDKYFTKHTGEVEIKSQSRNYSI